MGINHLGGRRAGELVEEAPRGLDREVVGEVEEMWVAGDEGGAFVFGEREQVVVVWVGRSIRARFRVGCEDGCKTEQRDKFGYVVGWDAAAEFRIVECTLELAE